MNGGQTSQNEISAIGLGSAVGFVAGAGLGGGITVLMGGYSLDVTLIVVLHTAVAMMLMGGWTAPSLLPREEEGAPLVAPVPVEASRSAVE